MSTKKKTWTGQEKLAIVLQGLRGNCRISELCNEHGITQGLFLQVARPAAVVGCHKHHHYSSV